MQKKSLDEIRAFVKNNNHELCLLSNFPNAIKHHAINSEPWADQYGDIQKDIVLAIRGYQNLFKELTGIDYQ